MAKASDNNMHLEENIKFPSWIEKTFDLVIGSILLVELVLLFGNTVLRSTSGISIVWANEIAEYALTSLAFIAGAIAYHRGLHMSVRVVLDRLPVKIKNYSEAFRHYIVLIIAIIGMCLAVPMFSASWTNLTTVLQIPKSWTLLPFIIGMVLMAVFAISELRRFQLKINIIVGAIVLMLGIIWYFAQNYFGPWNGLSGIGFAILLLLFLVFSGVPIAFVLTITAFMYIFGSKEASIMAVSFAMQNGISSFILLAVPFFILAGKLMTDGGLTKPMANCVCALVGRMRGGLMHAVVVSMYIFSGISGSKIADIAAVGTTMKDMLKEEGYDPAESAAVFSSAGIMGETVPPSLVMMVLASITTLSVATFFIAGLLPAALIALCIMAFIFFRAIKMKWPKCGKTSFINKVKVTFLALPALLVPLILIIGIAGGIATTTEVSSFAVVYAIIVSVFLYRGMNFRSLMTTMASAAGMSGMIMFMVSSGSAFSWTLAISGIQNIIVEFLKNLGGSSMAFMIFSIVTLILMGSILEGLPSLLIFGPLLLNLAGRYGINEMHFGIVLIISMGIGTFIPPFGICYFVTCSVLESSVEKVTSRYLPYLIIIFIGLVLIAVFPQISLYLPQLLHLSTK